MVLKKRVIASSKSQFPSLRPSVWASYDTPISTDRFGKTISAYVDWIWDFRKHVAANKSEGVIYFNKEHYISNPGYYQDVKHILWLLIEQSLTDRHTHTVSTYLRWASILIHLAIYCLDQSITIATCLAHEKIFLDFINHHCPESLKGYAISIAKTLFLVRSEILGCEVFDVRYSELEGFTASHKQEQTLVIPSRILFHCINTSQKIISDFLEKSRNLKRLSLQLHHETLDYSGKTENLHEAKISSLRFQQTVKKHKLSAIAASYHWNSPTSFGLYLSKVQFACKTLVHIYSGMRDDEAYSLFPGCFRNETIDGSTGYWLHGVTTKGYGRRVPAAWVTAIDLENAITASEEICYWIKQSCKIEQPIPLFSSISHFSFTMSHNRTKPDENGYKLANLTHIKFNTIYQNEKFIITEADYQEVRFIEYARNWDNEQRFVPGNYWHFTSHQFRRSLAYYGIESGLVRYSSLHDQLQHIRMRMTVHYSKGGSYADSLIGSSKSHFKHELIRVTSIVRALDYVQTVLLSEEKLIGGYGNHVERHIKPLGKEQILNSREKTVEQVKAGLLSFKPRATGGCMKATSCHQHLVHPLSACTGCAQGALIPSRVLLAILEFKKFIYTLHPGSPEHVSAMTEIELTTKQLKLQNIEIE